MKKSRKYIILAIVFVFIGATGLLIAKYGSTYAKYISNSIWNYYFKSKDFYFNSDYLDTTSKVNINKIWDGNKIDFNLKNYLNTEAITGYDINYNVVCTIEGDVSSHAECRLNGTSSNQATGTLSATQACENTTGDNIDVSTYDENECKTGGYAWNNQEALKDMYFDVVLTDNNYELKDVTVNITASSTSPYSKSISGSFQLYKVVNEEGSLTPSYSNYTNYDKLIITNSYDIDKCITVSWNSNNLLIDSNYANIISYNSDTNGYINNIKISINDKSSTSMIFYKRNSNTYDSSAFTIEESLGC